MQRYLKINRTSAVLLLIILVGTFLRFYNLNWDEGYYLHPDERLYVNASNIKFPQSFGEFLSPQSPLNPKMFYYGSFPLYVYKLVFILFSQTNFLVTSRAVSAIFSIATIIVVYLLGKEVSSKTKGIMAAFVFTFAVGSIQYAHFNTTESILTFLLALITFFSMRMVKEQNYGISILLGLLVGSAYATKIIGLTFAIIPAISFLFLILRKRTIYPTLHLILLFSISTIIAGIAFAPYQIIDYQQFSSQQDYMQGVILGKYKPPFTIIYEHFLPYAYQLIQVFPFSFGFVSFPLAIFGFILLLRDFPKKRQKQKLLFVLLYPILYFLWSGSWYVKFSRYSLLLFPFFSIWASFALEKIKKPFFVFILIIIAVNGILYVKVYKEQNTRIEASQWIYQNVPNASVISGEHWDDNLPLPMGIAGKTFSLKQLTVYDPDTEEKIEKLVQDLSMSDYFVISSRRVYYSILRNQKKYPLTSRFYALLFEEKLGFRLVKKFTNYPFYLSDDFADESFQSYDHPPVYIFKNQQRFLQNELFFLINK